VECEHCGLKYADLRTGLTYNDVYQMLWSGSDNPKTWRYKGRSGVLGLWAEIKRGMWKEHLRRCDEAAHYQGERSPKPTEAEHVDQIYPF
jgi:hypothetical protein